MGKTTTQEAMKVITTGYCTTDAAGRAEMDCTPGPDCVSTVRWLSLRREAMNVCSFYRLKYTEAGE